MIVDLTSLGGTGLDFSFEADSGQIDLGEEPARIKGVMLVEGRVTSDGKVHVTGTIEGVLELDCTRCLAPIDRAIGLSFDDVFVDAEGMADVPEGELRKTDMSADVLVGPTVDLAALAREQLLLSVPDQVLCREDCKGLCERCGADLNAGPCGCPQEETDPRWDVLKKLK